MSRLPPYRHGPENISDNRGSDAYRKAFENYLRYGTPIPQFEVKSEENPQHRISTHYIWRTRGDGKVRSDHAANDGKVFSWDDPPATGHPGEAPNCRCQAEPYLPETDELFDITLTNIADTGPAWSSVDFASHYFRGNGRAVTVRETGHLSKVVAEYRRLVIDPPTRLPGQIADVARENIGGRFSDTFNNTYPLTGIVFSVGNTRIHGKFKGASIQAYGQLEISGTIDFSLEDRFEDPADIGRILPEPYAKLDEVIAQAVTDTLKKVGSTIVDMAQLIKDAVTSVLDKIGNVERALEAYIYAKARREIGRRMRHGKNALSYIQQKDLRELPFSTRYDIHDQWNGSFTGKILVDRNKSKYKR